jgi:hypothetical protein
MYAVVALLYGSYIWHDDHAYLRALHELFAAASLALLISATWSPRLLGLATIATWLEFAVQVGPAP